MSDFLRLMSYNLLEGLQTFAACGDEHRDLDHERADAAISVVSALAPDFLVLNEALFCCTHEGRKTDYADIFSFPYETAALYDGAWGNAILSRYPIVTSNEMRIYNRGGLSALIDTPSGHLTVASYHPHPHRGPSDKAQDFARLVKDVAGPLIVCGDFNCISPEDKTEEQALIEAFRAFATDAEPAVRRFIDSGKHVFKTLAELGVADAVPVNGRRYTMPTNLINADKSSAMRIDHILANQAIEVLSGEVVQNASTELASDHHPVMIDFTINQRK